MGDVIFVVVMLGAAYWGWRSGAPRDQEGPRPGFLERRPDGSVRGKWGAEPRLREVRRAYRAVTRPRRW